MSESLSRTAARVQPDERPEAQPPCTKRIQRELCDEDAKTLRENDDVRASVQQSADEISRCCLRAVRLTDDDRRALRGAAFHFQKMEKYRIL